MIKTRAVPAIHNHLCPHLGPTVEISADWIALESRIPSSKRGRIPGAEANEVTSHSQFTVELHPEIEPLTS